ncbi:MAG: ferrochelatase [Pseudomonadota bacterium]
MTGGKRLAVVLFNLGGPDRPEAVQPFLFNLFNDPAIIGAPGPIRWALARFISSRRAPVAREIYAHLGGGSPLLPNTQAQADPLADGLADLSEVQVFIAMRYWHPLTEETVRAVKEYGPDQVVLLPLYPQYSTTTSGSSIKAWNKAARQAGLDAPTHTLCCYPRLPGFTEAAAALIGPRLDQAAEQGVPRLLFSAHGLPKKVIERGDPYQWQVEQTADAIVAGLSRPGLDWRVCYQSRVGPLEWIGPATDEEIQRAGRDQVPLVLFPVAFVSEHSETLVELDIEYRKLAEESGVPAYLRVPTVDAAEAFIAGLAGLVREAASGPEPLRSGEKGRICPADRRCCALAGGS